MSVEQQEAVIGRTKLDNIELADASASEQKSHKTLATIVDEDGTEHDILRDNMPFGRPGHDEYGTYFIGYSRYLWVTQKMLERMFLGDPPGMHDRLLDFSTARVAGSLIPHKSGVVKRRRRVGAGGAVNGTRAARVGPRCAGGRGSIRTTDRRTAARPA